MMYKEIAFVRYFSFQVGENICSWFPVLRDRAEKVQHMNWKQKSTWG